jgi:hypothetical protein
MDEPAIAVRLRKIAKFQEDNNKPILNIKNTKRILAVNQSGRIQISLLYS